MDFRTKIISIKKALLDKYTFLQAQDISTLAESGINMISVNINYSLNDLMKYIPVDTSSMKYPTYVNNLGDRFQILDNHEEREKLIKVDGN